MRSALTLVVVLGVIAWIAFTPGNPSRTHSPTVVRAVLQWLRVLGCRVVSLSRRDARPADKRAVRVREHAGGALVTSDDDAPGAQEVRAHKRLHPMVPPATPAPVDPRVRLDEWVRREVRRIDPGDRTQRAHLAREAERVHRVSRRTAQRAVRRVAGGAR